jgi:hypothetical protein
VRFDITRAQFDGAPVRGGGALKLLLVARGEAEAKVRLGVKRIERQRLFKRARRIRVVAGNAEPFAFFNRGIRVSPAPGSIAGQAAQK